MDIQSHENVRGKKVCSIEKSHHMDCNATSKCIKKGYIPNPLFKRWDDYIIKQWYKVDYAILVE